MISISRDRLLKAGTELTTRFTADRRHTAERLENIMDMQRKKAAIPLIAGILLCTLLSGMIVSCRPAVPSDLPEESTQENRTDRTEPSVTDPTVTVPEGGEPLVSPGSSEEWDSAYDALLGLSDFKGLEVYAAAFAPGAYRYTIMEGTNRLKTEEELFGAIWVGEETMRHILSTYDTPRENIFFLRYQHPLSSYLWILGEDGNFHTGFDFSESFNEEMHARFFS